MQAIISIKIIINIKPKFKVKYKEKIIKKKKSPQKQICKKYYFQNEMLIKILQIYKPQLPLMALLPHKKRNISPKIVDCK